MTSDTERPEPPDVLRVDDARLRRTAAGLAGLVAELDAVAEPREPDVGQRRLADGRLAIPICLPAAELSRLLGALADALVAVTRAAGRADADSAALAHLMLRDLP